MGKIKNIIKAYTEPTPEEEWYKERLDKCIGCEFNSENVDYNELSPAQKLQKKTKTAPKGFCILCSCPVDKKTSVKAEYCALKKIGKEPKWNSMEVEAGFGFTVETFSEDLGVYKEKTENVVDLGEVVDRKVIEFKVAINYNSNRYHFDKTNVSCGCVIPNLEEATKGELIMDIKVNTTGFSEGINEKRISVNFKNKNGKDYPTIVKIKAKK